jgi:Rab-GTPase-TBC domain
MVGSHSSGYSFDRITSVILRFVFCTTTAEMRRAAWHLLVGLDRIDPCQRTCSMDEKELDLIRRDANRSVLFRYHKRRVADRTPSGESTAQRDSSHVQQEQLATVLSSALSGGTKKLHYYQGLHDIAGVLLYNLQDTDHACAVLQRLCRLHLRDALREDLTHWTWLLDTVLLPILDSVDQELHDYLLHCGLECSNAILPWLITWFTHDIHDEQVASRLMDVLLSSHALFPL